MKRIIFNTVVCLGFLICSALAVHSGDLEDIDRTFKNLDREMRQQKQQQSLQQNFGRDFKRFNIEKENKKDKAVAKNEERFKKFMESQNKNLAKELESWGIRIPQQHRLIVELFAIAIFIILFSFIFYRQRHRKLEEEREAENKKKGAG